MTDDDRLWTDADPDLWTARRHADPDDPFEPGDPAGRRVVAALDRTRADLADHAASTPPMPDAVRADLARALADEPRPHRGSRARLLLVVAAALAAVVLAVGAVLTAGTDPVPPPEVRAGGAPADVPVLGRDDGPAALRAGLGRSDYGPLSDPARLTDCLVAHGVPPGVRPVGARPVVVAGAEGVLLVLPTGVAGRFRVLVVGPGCSTTEPFTVSDTLVGR